MPPDSDASDETSLIAKLVARADAGDGRAKDALFAALYEELHRLAQVHLHRSAGHMTLGTTTLLHEAYLDISKRNALAFPDRTLQRAGVLRPGCQHGVDERVLPSRRIA